MKGDTIEGAELGVAVAAALKAMMARGLLAAKALPLTCALLETLTRDVPLELAWPAFHREH